MKRLLSRENIKLFMVATVCLMVAWTGPAFARTVADYAKNSDRVDGKHAVGSGASLKKAKGKLVAHDKSGRLPAKFIPKVADADRVDGIDSRQLQFPPVVPPGQTITGRWGFDGDGSGTGDWGASISYPVRLPSVPVFEYVAAAPSVTCPGSYLAPTAPPGRLCVYRGFAGGLGSSITYWGSSVHGITVLFGDDNSPGDVYAYGSYAYQAPTTPTPRPRLMAPDTTKK
ncbi:hypothetical protein [Nocardioides sp.]|uniref:hypothetical protein n=1 Tax=Nocardioides sp. TaxID=35761 RepID=UPI0027344186|nr:hypothetical protein [Nocardioides sp.]MDP3889908.1 hypothetical protein [Nocardioides sp.]